MRLNRFALHIIAFLAVVGSSLCLLAEPQGDAVVRLGERSVVAGRLRIVVFDEEGGPRPEYYVVSDGPGGGGSGTRLQFANGEEHSELRPGMFVKATGRTIDEGSLAVFDIAEIPAPDTGVIQGEERFGPWKPKADALLPHPENLLIMLGHFPGSSCPCQSLTAAQAVAYTDPNHHSLRDYYLAASHGGISQFNVKVMPDVQIPVPASAPCNYDIWADELDDAARNAPGDKTNPADYTRTMYILAKPPNNTCFQGTGGWAEIGGRRSFVLTCAIPGMAHELGHSLGMGHANRLGVEYADPYDPMVQGTFSNTIVREVNAPHRIQLNWIPDGGVVNVKQSGNYSVGSLERDGLAVPQVLRIKRSTVVDDYIYVSYREGTGEFDSGMNPPGATHVYRWDGGPTDLRLVLADGDVYEEPGIARIQQISHTGSQGNLRIDLGVYSPPPPPPPPAPTCTPTATSICIQNNRIQISVKWKTSAAAGDGQPVSFSNDTAFFWFFDRNNPELAVKVLDAGGGRFWVFYGGLTNQEYTITVTDTTTGNKKTYFNPTGSICGGADTNFPAPGPVTSGGRSPAVTSGLDTSLIKPCAPDADTLCLQPGGHVIKVESSYSASTGQSGAGTGGLFPNSTQGGYFSFFGAGNIELMVKAVDGRPVNGKFWMFAGVLSDVDYTVRFTDVTTGRWLTIHNFQGTYCGYIDVNSIF